MQKVSSLSLQKALSHSWEKGYNVQYPMQISFHMLHTSLFLKIANVAYSR